MRRRPRPPRSTNESRIRGTDGGATLNYARFVAILYLIVSRALSKIESISGVNQPIFVLSHRQVQADPGDHCDSLDAENSFILQGRILFWRSSWRRGRGESTVLASEVRHDTAQTAF